MNNLFLSKALLVIAFFTLIHGCGGREGGKNAYETQGDILKNYSIIKVDRGVTGDYVNGLFTTINVCVPNNDTCYEIDNVLVDTGSTGVRLLSSSLPSVNIDFKYDVILDKNIAECSQFVSGVMWGGLIRADIKINGELAKNIPIQILGDSSFSSVPSDCSSRGQVLNSVQSLGANGVLGISNFMTDCGLHCSNLVDNFYYYQCSLYECSKTALAEAQQVQNPVAHFRENNNGTIIELPAVSDVAKSSISGKLIFGINTQVNNKIGSAKKITLDSKSATFSTIYKSRSYSQSYFDSGSNGIYFDDASLAECSSVLSSYYCPVQTLQLDVLLHGVDTELYGYKFSVGNAFELIKNYPNMAVQPYLVGLGGGTGQDFVWGLPFYFGKRFFTSIEGRGVDTPNIYCAYE
ncbi:DUF3443 family protein [Limnohabitans sp. B9-3]|uniref:DUF3443 family protein n=1 Tax=Limnohabitans sp. B9-3 TaxID=1100707 RepID=UPI000C1EF500|nr:DUF3443 family protein [Limnohabitans sp. B9-3]PIT77698.1 hypothetical protein B9Z42_04375 [Limnohabitans sp. B9-3]